jgi:hypothetical protein
LDSDTKKVTNTPLRVGNYHIFPIIAPQNVIFYARQKMLAAGQPAGCALARFALFGTAFAIQSAFKQN